jgi:hypothetical protein
MSQPQFFRAAPTRTPSQALAYCRIGRADGMEVVLIALDAGAVDFDLNFDLNDAGVDAVDRCAESFWSICRLAVIPIVRLRSDQAFPRESVRNGSRG